MTINPTALHLTSFANMSNNDMAATRWLSEVQPLLQTPCSTLKTAISTGNFAPYMTMLENPPILPKNPFPDSLSSTNAIASALDGLLQAPVYARSTNGALSLLSLDSAGKEPLTYAQLAQWHKEVKAQVVYFSNVEALTGISGATGLYGSSGVVWNWITNPTGPVGYVTLTTNQNFSGDFGLGSSGILSTTQVLPQVLAQADAILNSDIYHLDISSSVLPINPPLNPV